MSDWLSINDWSACVRMQKPGIIFEIRNADGQSMLTPCTQVLPSMPFDWRSAPVQFRAVLEPRPRHSAPLPIPRGPR